FVDPTQRIASVQSGVTWAELDRQTQAHGLAVTGGVVSSTGVAGLTLGGGLGWLMGKHGLALDNLRSVELVTATGDFVRTSEGETAMQSLKQLGSPAMDGLGAMPYCVINRMLDAAYPKGALNYWKSSFLSTLSDDAIDTMIDCFARCPTPMGQIILEHVHGAV